MLELPPVSPSSSARNSASQRSYSYNMGRFRLRGSHIWLDGMGRLHNSNRLSNRTSHARGLCFPSCPRFTQPDRSALAKTVEGDENLVDNKNKQPRRRIFLLRANRVHFPRSLTMI